MYEILFTTKTDKYIKKRSLPSVKESFKSELMSGGSAKGVTDI